MEKCNEERELSIRLAETISTTLKEMGLEPNITIDGDTVRLEMDDASKEDVLKALDKIKNNGSR